MRPIAWSLAIGGKAPTLVSRVPLASTRLPTLPLTSHVIENTPDVAYVAELVATSTRAGRLPQPLQMVGLTTRRLAASDVAEWLRTRRTEARMLETTRRSRCSNVATAGIACMHAWIIGFGDVPGSDHLYEHLGR